MLREQNFQESKNDATSVRINWNFLYSYEKDSHLVKLPEQNASPDGNGDAYILALNLCIF